ncbi:MAG: hypothetical protein IAE82_21510 [Opitutaceae bacterium]|nr:hypothetical protein [Opitutaceae bacterium]
MPLADDPESLDAADLGRLDAQWTGLLRDHFATTPPGRFERAEAVLDEVPSDYLGEQIATHLESLGYLTRAGAAGFTPPEVWRPAFEVWKADQRAEELRASPAVRVDLGGEDLGKLSADERAIRVLKAQCSFEGETSLRVSSEDGDDTLAVRIARHRLRCFGLLDEQAPLAAVDRAAVDAVAAELARPAFPTIDWLDLLGDIPELTSRFVQTQAHRVFVFGRTPAAEAWHDRFRIRRRSKSGLGQGTFRSAAARRRHDRAGGIEATHGPAPALRTTLVPGLVEARGAGEDRPPVALTRFALVLLQVRLWMFGYYAGALDGRWGVMTARALERFILEHEAEGGGGSEALAPRPEWLRGNSNELVIDLGYLFSFMVARLDEAAEITARSEIDALVNASLQGDASEAGAQERLGAAEVELSHDLLEAHEKRRALQREDREAVEAAGAASGGRRRRYFGWRAVFGLFGRALRWIGRSIRKTLRWLRERIRKVVHYATTFLNYIREKTRRAVRLAALGLQRLRHWLTGAPVGTMRGEALVLTSSSLDFDTLNFAGGSVDADLVGDHLVRLECLNAGFGFLVEVALGVWSVVSALKYAFANWLLLAWRAFKAVRRALEYVDEHEALLDRLEPAVL